MNIYRAFNFCRNFEPPAFFGVKGVVLGEFGIFFLRAVLGGVFAVILSRFFYPDAQVIYVMGLGIILVGLAYFADYLRNRKSR